MAERSDAPRLRSTRLDGKAIVVTGGTQGLGEAIAGACAEAGARAVCIVGRDRARGENVADRLGTLGCEMKFVSADLASEADCCNVISSALEWFGTLDGLVNAAGLTDRGTLEETTVELWDKLFAVNVRAPFILTRELVRALKSLGKGGSIVNISSRASHGGMPITMAYSTTKGALVTMTKNNANALRAARVRVNAINMGWTDTTGERRLREREGQAPDWFKRVQAQLPFGRLLEPEEIATLVTYLLSDATQMMTGSIIDFDQNVVGTYGSDVQPIY